MIAITLCNRWSDTLWLTLGQSIKLKSGFLRISLLSPDMYSFVFSCVLYSCLKAFGKKRENKAHRNISHSTVFISRESNNAYCPTYLFQAPIFMVQFNMEKRENVSLLCVGRCEVMRFVSFLLSHGLDSNS